MVASAFTVDQWGDARIAKDPDAVLEYTLDWDAWLADADELSAIAFTVPTGVTKDSEEFTSDTATVWLSGGTAGDSYKVTCHITTSAGREDDRTFYVDVKER